MTHNNHIHKYTVFTPQNPEKEDYEGERFIAVKHIFNAAGNPIALRSVEGSLSKPDDDRDTLISWKQLLPRIEDPLKFNVHEITLYALDSAQQRLSDLLEDYDSCFHHEQVGHDYTQVEDGVYEIKRSQGGILALYLAFNETGKRVLIERKETPGVEPPIYQYYSEQDIAL